MANCIPLSSLSDWVAAEDDSSEKRSSSCVNCFSCCSWRAAMAFNLVFSFLDLGDLLLVLDDLRLSLPELSSPLLDDLFLDFCLIKS